MNNNAIPLPKGFTWTTIPLNQPINTSEPNSESVILASANNTTSTESVVSADIQDRLYKFLKNHYVANSTLRMEYSADYLSWLLSWNSNVTLYNNEDSLYKGPLLFSLAIVSEKKPHGSIYGYISGLPINCIIDGERKLVLLVNLLCVHSKLREKRMAGVLISELKRKVSIHGIDCSMNTSGAYYERFNRCSVKYCHRALNAPKLIDLGYWECRENPAKKRDEVAQGDRNFEIRMLLKSLDHDSMRDGIEPVTEMVIEELQQFLIKEMNGRYRVTYDFSDINLVRNMFSIIPNVNYTFFRRNTDGVIVDIYSFTLIMSNLINSDQNLLRAYGFHSVSTESISENIRETMIMAKEFLGADEFIAIPTLQNEDAITDRSLQFREGSGDLHYNFRQWDLNKLDSSFIDWNIPMCNPNDIGVTMC